MFEHEITASDIQLAYPKIYDEILKCGFDQGRAKGHLEGLGEHRKSISPSVNESKIDVDLPLDQRAKAAWDKIPDLRAEFRDNFNSYFAYLKNFEAGNIRVAAGPVKK